MLSHHRHRFKLVKWSITIEADRETEMKDSQNILVHSNGSERTAEMSWTGVVKTVEAPLLLEPVSTHAASGIFQSSS